MKVLIEVCEDCPYKYHPCPEGCSKIVDREQIEQPYKDLANGLQKHLNETEQAMRYYIEKCAKDKH